MHLKTSNLLTLVGTTVLGLSAIVQAQIILRPKDGFKCLQYGTGKFSDTLTASVLASTGKTLKATIVLTANGITETVVHGDDTVYIKQGSGSSPDNATVDITLGPNFYKGISQMSTTYNTKDQTILGTIDGRQLATYKKPPPSLKASTAEGPKMADGGAAPT